MSSSPSLATATPSPSGMVRELVPRVARVFRPTARTGFWGNGRVFPALPPRLLTGFQGSLKDQKGKEGRLAGATPQRPTNQPRPERDSSSIRTPLKSISNIRLFCSPGLRPSLRLAPRPVPRSTPLRGVSRKVSKGGVPPPWPRHTAHPPMGSELPHPSSCQPR